MYTIKIRSKALRQLEKLPRDMQERITNKLTYYSQTDNPLFFAERLTHFSLGQYRYRVGDYRIIFDLVEQVILVIAIGHRSEIYK